MTATSESAQGSPSYVDGLPESDYFAHPALSCSEAKLLLPPSCPAKYMWRKLNPPDSKKQFDFGHAAHNVALGEGAEIMVIEADSWRTKAAQELQALAYETGKVPLLVKDYETVTAMADALRLHPVAGKIFANAADRGVSERSFFWRDDEFGIDRRCRVDWGVYEGARILLFDYKTANSAEPDAFSHAVRDYNYHMQDPFYRDGVAARFDASPDDIGFVFVVQEKSAPYIVQVYELDDDARRVGNAKNRTAMEVFAECRARGEWPEYGSGVVSVGIPSWADRAYL